MGEIANERLTRANELGDLGTELLPVRELPLHLFAPYGSPVVNLSFVLPREYIQLLEETRATAPAKDMRLTLHMWGMAAMGRLEVLVQRTLAQGRPSSGKIAQFERFETGLSGESVTIEHFAWVDCMLPGLVYVRGILVELPLLRISPAPKAYQGAVEALEQAVRAFRQEDYCGAV